MIKKIRRMDKQGVSEVVGTILVLSITVALFSSIFAAVSLMEGPDHRTYIDFDASFVRVEDNYTLEITHKGGRTLERFNTAFNIVVYDGRTYRNERYMFDSENVTFPGEFWRISEKVRIDLGDLPMKLDYDNWEDMLAVVDIAELMVMDTGRNTLVWRTEFKLGEPPLKMVIKDMGVEYPQEWARFVEPGGSVRLYARMGPRELLGGIEITVDISSLLDYEEHEPVTMSRDSGDRFVYPPRNQPGMAISSRQENGTYRLDVTATYTGDDSSESGYISLNVGPVGDVYDQPNVNIVSMRFNPVSPLNRERVTVFFVVENRGGSSALCNITLYDNYTGDHEDAKLIRTIYDETVPAGGGRNLEIEWVVRGSGAHNITLVAEDIRSAGGENLNPDPRLYRTLHVQPTILLVDDDKVTDGDAAMMYGDLKSAAFRFDHFDVAGRDGPRYDEGRLPLKNYDIVIWMTGKETEHTLTVQDQEELETFLNNGGNLWLIGQGIWYDLTEGNAFLREYMKAENPDGQLNIPDGNIRGENIPLDYTEFEVVPGNYKGYYMNHVDVEGAYVSAVDGTNRCIAVSYDSGNYRTMFNSFLFGSMEGNPVDKDLDTRTDMVFKVINWLGGVEFAGGNDVAVAEQRFNTHTPRYMERVHVDYVIRNNGQDDLTGVEVILTVEKVQVNYTFIDLDGMGGTYRGRFSWQADSVGVHEILVVVDPWDRIEETNTENNDIRYKDVNYHVNVLFSVLVVDDDQTNSNTAAHVIESLERLGYAYKEHTVGSGGTGPRLEDLKLYNSIFWVCGHSDDTLKGDDIEAITRYLSETGSTSFFLMGNRVLHDLTENPPDGARRFLRDVMGINPDNITSMSSFPENFDGIVKDPIGHGLAYRVESHLAQPPHTFEVLDGEVFLTDTNGNAIASRHQFGQSRTVFMGVDMFHMDGPVYDDSWYGQFSHDVDTSPAAVRQELTYMITRWFGNVDDRVELRVSAVDITVESTRPMLGRSYLLSASIHNVGFRTAGARVRFKDGSTLIDSEDIYVAGNGVTTAEISWQPLFAGPQRPIRILVDPLGNLEEIGNKTAGNHMGFNNHAMIHLPVYYFWDDMENGTANWRTEATIMNINAEHPLEFMSDYFDRIYTDVVSEWDEGYEDASKYINVTDIYSYSDPRSYWLQEPAGEEVQEDIPIDVVFAIDTSGSMQWNDQGSWVGHTHPDSRWYQARIATVSFIENLTENDRSAVWIFRNTSPHDTPMKVLPDAQLLSLAYMCEANRTTFINYINNINPNSWTPMFDTIGEAIWNIAGRDDYDEHDNSRLEFVVALTDGLDNRNYFWARNEPFTGYRTGLLDAPPMVFNVAMTCEPLRFSEDYPRAPEWRYHEHPRYWDGYAYNHDRNLEYWYWAAATTSTCYPGEESKYGFRAEDAEHGDRLEGQQYVGRYIYAETGAEVVDLFEEILQQIMEMADRKAEAGNVTYMPGDDTISGDQNNDILDGPELPVEGRNYNKTAVTPAFNLTGYSAARLTFWHKYKIVPGMNGAFLQVGFNDENGNWVWRYVVPTHGTYTGNMNMAVGRQDDFGNSMNWAWNGISGGGSFTWDHVQVNVLPYIDRVGGSRENVRIRFNYTQYGSGTGYGWFLDDVKLVVSRDPGAPVTDNMKDVWRQVTTNGTDGEPTTAWWNGQGVYGEGDPWFLPGIDNSLVTSPIDLTNALTAELSAHFKFNINTERGAPPDGFRVEVTIDGGRTWQAINTEWRTAEGVSQGSNNWESAGDLDRLNVNLVEFAGRVIRLRFRVFTTNHGSYDHYEDNTVGFGGFYVDNVIVRGRTILEG